VVDRHQHARAALQPGPGQFGHTVTTPARWPRRNTWHWSNVSISPAVRHHAARGFETTSTPVRRTWSISPGQRLPQLPSIRRLASSVSVSFKWRSQLPAGPGAGTAWPTEGQFQINRDLFGQLLDPGPAGATSVIFKARTRADRGTSAIFRLVFFRGHGRSGAVLPPASSGNGGS